MKTKKRNEPKKESLIKELAHFLCDATTEKSAMLEMERKRPDNDPRPNIYHQWAALRQASGLAGWVPYEEAVEHLKKVLG